MWEDIEVELRKKYYLWTQAPKSNSKYLSEALPKDSSVSFWI